MNTKIIYLLYTAAFLLHGCNNESSDSFEYYPSGLPKRIISKPDAQDRGTTQEYYPDGKLECRFHWQGGQKEGKTEYFFPNGKLEEVTFWRNGKPNGAYRQYYNNGSLKKTSTLKNGIEIGEIVVFDEKGKRIGFTIHNEQGREIYAAQYDQKGKLQSGMLIPVIDGKKDSLYLGEVSNVQIRFGYKLRGTLSMFVGKGTSRGVILDTFAVVHPDSNGLFKYNFKPKKAGLYSVTFKFEHNTNKDDTLQLHELFFKRNFNVIK